MCFFSQVGPLHYWCVITSFLAQMPGFESGWPSATAAAATETPLKFSNLTTVQLAGAALFAWAFVQHHKLLI